MRPETRCIGKASTNVIGARALWSIADHPFRVHLRTGQKFLIWLPWEPIRTIDRFTTEGGVPTLDDNNLRRAARAALNILKSAVIPPFVLDSPPSYLLSLVDRSFSVHVIET